LETLRLICKAEKELKGILMKPRLYKTPFEREGNYRQIGKYKPAKLRKSNLCPYNSQTRHVANPIARDKAFVRSGGLNQGPQTQEIAPFTKKEQEHIQQKIYRPIAINPTFSSLKQETQDKTSVAEKKSTSDSRSKSSEKDKRKREPEEDKQSEIVYQNKRRQELMSQDQKERDNKTVVNHYCESTTVASSSGGFPNLQKSN